MSGDELASQSVDTAIRSESWWTKCRKWCWQCCTWCWQQLCTGWTWLWHQACVAAGTRVGYCPKGPSGRGYSESIPVFFFIVAQTLALIVTENGTIRSANDTARTQTVNAFACISVVTALAFVVMILATKPVPWSADGTQEVHVFDRGAVILMRIFLGFSLFLIYKITTMGWAGDLPGQRAMDLLRVERAFSGEYEAEQSEASIYSGYAVRADVVLSQFDFPNERNLPTSLTGTVRLAKGLHEEWWVLEVKCFNEMPLSDGPQSGSTVNAEQPEAGSEAANNADGVRVKVIQQLKVARDVRSPAAPFRIPEIDLRSRHRLEFTLIPRGDVTEDTEEAAEDVADLIDSRKDGVFQVTVQPALEIDNPVDESKVGKVVAVE